MTMVSNRYLVLLFSFVAPQRKAQAFVSSALGASKTCFIPPSAAAASARPVVDYFKGEQLGTFLPKDNVLAIADEILSNQGLIDDTEALVTGNWKSIEARVRGEDRSTREILGEGTTQRLLDAVEDLDGYDPGAVRAFLSSDAINNLFAKILYDGIFEFFQKIDVFGNIISNLPIIGPIRNQIITETKRSLDRSLGPLVQSFLGSYTRIAVNEAVDFVLSPSNTKAFGGANVRLISSLLERPVNTLLPDSGVTDTLRDDAFAYLRNVDMKDVESALDFVYEIAGDKAVADVVDVDRVLDASPTLQRTVDRLWERAVEAAGSG